MKKKFYHYVVAAVLSAGMVVSMTACGGQKSPVELNTGGVAGGKFGGIAISACRKSNFNWNDQLSGKYRIESE